MLVDFDHFIHVTRVCEVASTVHTAPRSAWVQREPVGRSYNCWIDRVPCLVHLWFLKLQDLRAAFGFLREGNVASMKDGNLGGD